MTLTVLITYIALVAIALTLVTHFALKATRSLWMSLLQNFCGAWFLFSGYVKVVDPLGTAYKMEQYFDEFSNTAVGAGWDWLAPLFTWGSSVSIWVATTMVVLEVVLGLLLILGDKPRFTGWLFLLVMFFFTALTGFTFLTGYVPTESNFFTFANWTPFTATNMRVTDCGCFGDFLKLEPFTSFLKDCFLMIPALLFVIFPNRMHQLFTQRVRLVIGLTVTVLASIFAMSNFVWGLPVHDFRPFAEGKDLRTQKEAEAQAASDVEITAYGITNKATGEYLELPFDDYMKKYAEYPEDKFELIQITTEPAIARTKLSDFELEDTDGTPMAEEILNEPGYTAMIIAYKLYDDGSEQRALTMQDSMFITDTAATGEVSRVFAAMRERNEMSNVMKWDADYVARWTEKIIPFADAAEKAGWKVFAATKYNDNSVIDDFRHAVQFAHPIYKGDDIMLKTIIRSNPGIVILKDGKVVKHLHWRHVPKGVEGL